MNDNDHVRGHLLEQPQQVTEAGGKTSDIFSQIHV